MAFLDHGYEVFWPAIHSSPIDLIIRKDGVYQTAQVKTAFRRSNGTYRVHTYHYKYTRRSFDLFVAVCPDGHTWIAPWDSRISRRASLSLVHDMERL